MKRIITFIIAAVMCFAMTSCGKQINIENNSEKNVEVQIEPQVSDDANINIAPDTKLQAVDLAGPWHLDNEKNDLDAITAAWETFPGYAEWGAGMEIRSNDQMSWYIGAAGGSGAYTIEGNILHAELLDTMEQKDVAMDFVVTCSDEIKMTYADTEIIWAYGDRENVSANDGDCLPGPDVADLVNMRGDEATVYKLADGTYMDRIERRFIYNGTDTWTDEAGIEWNEKVQ